MKDELPVAVIGAGPVGLAAAAHLLERGLEPLVIEKGREVGAAVRQWGHVTMFSPWAYNIDGASRRLLERAGWTAPDQRHLPTGEELVEHYLEPLAALPSIKPRLLLGNEVLGVGRADMDKVKSHGREEAPFALRLRGEDGRIREISARAVIDASGTWGEPNPLGAGGMPIAGEADLHHEGLIAYAIPDVKGIGRSDYAGKTVLVAGAGHSAINVILDLAELQRTAPTTRIVWALRRPHLDGLFGGGAADQLQARGELGRAARRAIATGAVELLNPFRTRSLARTREGRVLVSGLLGETERRVEVDRVVAATGFRPDLRMLREIRLKLDPWLECPEALGPLIDPNVHSCGTVRPHGEADLRQPERDFYILGMKAYGRAPTFLLATGYEQARSVSAALAGDLTAAARVELQLPETGVCGGTGRAKVTVDAFPQPGCCP